jgi:hypothetical protein
MDLFRFSGERKEALTRLGALDELTSITEPAEASSF